MRKDIFSIPIFEDSVDLSKINISDEPTKPTWDSETPTTFSAKHEVTSETWEHLIEVSDRLNWPINKKYCLDFSDIHLKKIHI